MKTSNRFPRLRPANAARRTKLLNAFDRSGLSAAEFARQQGLTYSTFCGWRHRRDQAKPPACAKATAGRSPDFVQIEVPRPAASDHLVIELAAGARIRISSAGQIELAVRLLQSLIPTPPC